VCTERCCESLLLKGGKNGSDHIAFIGNSWKPEAFLKASLDKEHPIDSHGALYPEYYQLVFDLLTRSKAATVKLREAKLLEAKNIVAKFKADGSRKIRFCDDFNECLINATTGTIETKVLRFDSLDQVAGTTNDLRKQLISI
jgi:hypothetical protein